MHSVEPRGSESAFLDEGARLDELENKSIHILREAYVKYPGMAMLWSMGKDSTVMLWLLRKAFLGHCPIPLIHIDTSYKMPEMIAFRDTLARAWNLKLTVAMNTVALGSGMHPDRGRLDCCTALKTDALKGLLADKKLRAILVAIRRDEEGSRAKERYFSPRDGNSLWNFKEQPPELWRQYQSEFPPEMHVRIHPLLHWTELDVWLYIRRENIPVLPLYFAREGRRYRSVGCAPCTGSIASEAKNLDDIITELRGTRVGERAGRAQDKVDTHAMQKLRVKGYM